MRQQQLSSISSMKLQSTGDQPVSRIWNNPCSHGVSPKGEGYQAGTDTFRGTFAQARS